MINHELLNQFAAKGLTINEGIAIDARLVQFCVAGSCHTDNPIEKVYADKGYFGKNNREFLHLNKIADGIMRKAVKGTELTPYEKERNKAISKIRYIVEQYFGISHLHNNAFRARFTRMIKNAIDALFRQMDFNLLRGTRVLKQHRKGGILSY
jgi:IS5 family transposase